MHQDFHGIHLGAFGGHSNLQISKTKNFFFTQNSPPTHLVVSCHAAKLAMCKTQATQNFRAPRLSWYSFGEIVGNSILHISKTTNFIFFSQNSPPCHLAKSCHTAKLGHVQNQHNSKLLFTKIFMVFILGYLEAIPTFTSQKPRISLCRATPLNLAMCKTHTTQYFCAPRLSWYSFGGIWRSFQPSLLKNKEFHFFTKLPTKRSSCVVPHRQIGHVQT